MTELTSTGFEKVETGVEPAGAVIGGFTVVFTETVHGWVFIVASFVTGAGSPDLPI